MTTKRTRRPERSSSFVMWAALLVAAATLLGGTSAARAEGTKRPASFKGDAAVDRTCVTCHEKAGLKKADGHPVTVDGAKVGASLHGQKEIGCVGCHVDLANPKTARHPSSVAGAVKTEPVDCLRCHEEAPPHHKFHPQMVAKPDQVACQDCHGGHELLSPKDPTFKFARANQAEACGPCHELMRDEFKQSAHAKGVANGMKEAPDCIACHETALVTPPPGGSALILRRNEAKMCLACHLDKPEVRSHIGPTAGFVTSFETSVHGRALAAGNEKAPSCSSCHGSHAITKGADPSSQVSRANMAETCAACHEEQAKAFKGSIHGQSLAKGNQDSPTCTTCHGEHDILKHDDPRAAVARGNVSQKVCAPCHASVKLAAKYGIRSDRGETFERSYHGLAMKSGDVEVANCASCHGVHDIRPSSDPASRIHPSHLVATCGQCHPGANERFTNSPVHVTMVRQSDPVLYWLSTLYLAFVVIIVGTMVLHNALDFVKRARRRLAHRTGETAHPPVPHRLYLRLTVSERWQHAALIVSFATLVFTGFMLRYPDASWVEWVRSGHARVFAWRGLVHRAAGVLLLVAGGVHIGYLAFTQRGRSLFFALLPRRQDLADAWGVMRYNLGFSKEKPAFDRFSYAEKLEYWALVWGTIIMGVTGLVMWFDNSTMRVLSKHGYDIARVIHFFEAWLATLSVIVWHFYFVIFNPDAYPMNLAWLTGKLTEQEMAEDHPRELARLLAESQEKAAAEAQKPSAEAQKPVEQSDNASGEAAPETTSGPSGPEKNPPK